MLRTALSLLAALTAAALPGVADATGVPLSAATPAQHKEAQRLFVEGKTAFDAERYAAALEAFRTSYDTVASPNSHLFIARSLVMLGSLAEGYRAYGLVAAEAAREAAADDKYGATKVAADTEQAELRPRLAFVTVHLTHAPADARVSIGGAPRAAAELAAPVAVDPGEVQVVVDVNGGRPERRTVAAKAGESAEITLDLTPAPAAPAPVDAVAEAPGPDTGRGHLRTAAYVAGGLGAAGLVTFIVAGSMARSQLGSLKDECNGHCPPARQPDIDAGKRDQTIANVGLAVGLVGLGAGTALYLFSRPKQGPTASGAPALVTAEVAAGPAWLGLKGTFQ